LAATVDLPNSSSSTGFAPNPKSPLLYASVTPQPLKKSAAASS
jgi:hypothetical protein